MKEQMVIVEREQLADFARELLVELKPDTTATILALSGNLGAGKTTFVKALAAVLGVQEEVTSPTFTIMRTYGTNDPIWKNLVHMDAYRIENSEELKPLRLAELFAQPQTLVVIEWAEKIAEVLPQHLTWLEFSNTENETVRNIRIAD